MRFLLLLFLMFFCSTAKSEGIKVIAFDCFGTVYDLSNTPKDEIRDYIRQVKTKPWKPLELPSSWVKMPVFPDSKEGIDKLRGKYIVVTCANGPMGMLARMAKRNNIHFDLIIPLEMNKVYKPDIKAYQSVCDILDVKPEEVLMVTGNEGSPDLFYPKQIGMKTIRIRSESGPKNIIELAEFLEK